MDIRQITETFSVSPQIAASDLADLKARGFRTVMNNRPDGEAPDQPPSADIKAAALAQGLAYVELPIVSGRITAQDVEAFRRVMHDAAGPMLAYCRTGTRCANMWALARAGDAPTGDLVRQAAAAGYDLSGLAPTLDALAAQRR